jgi:hypothetical protein
MFFVGDAAGRMGGHATSRMKDHGDTDRYVFGRHSDEEKIRYEPQDPFLYA